MFEWLSNLYVTLITNYRILLTNPTQCGTVDLLRLFSLTLFFVLLIKVGIHLVVFTLLKHRFLKYSGESNPKLWNSYCQAVRKVRLSRVPPLFKFAVVRPLIFTIGSVRPAIFMSPHLVDKISSDELEAALVHELSHIKRRDNLLIWFMEIFFAAIPLLIIQVFALSFTFSVANSVYALLGALTFVLVFKLLLWKRILFLRELSCDDVSVDATKAPLTLASSLVKVWRLGSKLPRYPWHTGLGFAQTLLPSSMNLEFRINRLLDYRRPRLKFLLGKAFRYASGMAAALVVIFLWQFYSQAESRGKNGIKTEVIPIVGYFASCSLQDEATTRDNQIARSTRVLTKFASAIKSRDAALMDRVLSRPVAEKLPLNCGDVRDLTQSH